MMAACTDDSKRIIRKRRKTDSGTDRRIKTTSKRGQSSLYILLWTDDHHAKCNL